MSENNRKSARRRQIAKKQRESRNRKKRDAVAKALGLVTACSETRVAITASACVHGYTWACPHNERFSP